MFVPEFFNVLARVGRNARVDFQVVFWILRNVWNRLSIVVFDAKRVCSWRVSVALHEKVGFGIRLIPHR